MKLLIVRTRPLPGDAPNYRGTARQGGGVDDKLPLDHPSNVVAFEHIRAGGETGVLSDLAAARTIVLGYQTRPHPEQLEIVELVSPGEWACAGTRFLGWDISAGGYGDSQLRFGLRHGRSASGPSSMVAMIDELEARFAPLLNRTGLFSDKEAADECLAALRRIETAHHSVYEPLDGYEVVSLFECD